MRVWPNVVLAGERDLVNSCLGRTGVVGDVRFEVELGRVWLG